MSTLPQPLASTPTAVLVAQPRLSFRMVKAARLLAEEELTQQEIAKRIGVSEYAICRWKRNFPAFVALVESYRVRLRTDVLDRGIANKEARIKKLGRMHAKIERVVDARAKDAAENPLFVGVPGAESGLITRDRKCIGGGEHGEFIDVFTVDHDLIKRHNEILEQVAREKGEYEPDKRPVGDEHKHVHIHYPQMTDAEAAQAVAAQQADMPPAARRLLTRPSDGKPLDR